MLASFFLHQSLQSRHVACAENPLLQFLSVLLQSRLEVQALGVIVELPMPVLYRLVCEIEFVCSQTGGSFIQVYLLIELVHLAPSGSVCSWVVACASDSAVLSFEAEGLTDDVYLLAEVGNGAKPH